MSNLILTIYLCLIQIIYTKQQTALIKYSDQQNTLNKFYLETRSSQSINLENFKLSLWFRQIKFSHNLVNELLSIKCNTRKDDWDDNHMNPITIQEYQTLINIIYLDDDNNKKQYITSVNLNQEIWIRCQITGWSGESQIYFQIELQSIQQNIEFTFQSDKSELQKCSAEYRPQLYNYQKIKISEFLFSELQSNGCVPGCSHCDLLNPFICHICNQYEQVKKINCECLENKYQYDDLCISQQKILQKQTIFVPIIQIYEFSMNQGNYVHNGSIYQDCEYFLTEQTTHLLSRQVNSIELRISFTNQITNWVCQSPFFRIKLSLQQESDHKVSSSIVMNSTLVASYISIAFIQYYSFITTDISIVAEIVQLSGLKIDEHSQKVQIYFNKSLEAKQLMIQIYNVSFIKASIDYSMFIVNSNTDIIVNIEKFKILNSNLTIKEHLFYINPPILSLRVDLKYFTIKQSSIDQYSIFQPSVIQKLVIHLTTIQHSIIARTILFAAAQIVSDDVQIFQTQFLETNLYANALQLEITDLTLYNVIFQGLNSNLIVLAQQNSVAVIYNVILSYLNISEIGSFGLINIQQSLGVLIKNFTVFYTTCTNQLILIQAQKIHLNKITLREIVLYLHEELASVILLQGNSTRAENIIFNHLQIHGDILQKFLAVQQTQISRTYLRNVILKNITLSHFIVNQLNFISDTSIMLFENVRVEIYIEQSNSTTELQIMHIKCSQIVMKNSKFYFNHISTQSIKLFSLQSSQIVFERSSFSLDLQAPEQLMLFVLKATQITLNQCNFTQITMFAKANNILDSYLIIKNSEVRWNRLLPNKEDLQIMMISEFLEVNIINNYFQVNQILKQLIHLTDNIIIKVINNYFYAVSQNILVAFLQPISEIYIQNNSITGMIFPQSLVNCQQYHSIAIFSGQTISIEKLLQINFNASSLYTYQCTFLKLINIEVKYVFHTGALLEIHTFIQQNTVIINNVTLIGIKELYKCQSNGFKTFVQLIKIMNQQAKKIQINHIQIIMSFYTKSMMILQLIEFDSDIEISNIFLQDNQCGSVCLIIILDKILYSQSDCQLDQVYFFRNYGAKMMVIIQESQQILLSNIVMNNKILFYSTSTSQAIQVQNIEIYEHQIETISELFEQSQPNQYNLIRINYNFNKNLTYFINNYLFLGKIIEVSFDDGIQYQRNIILNSEYRQLKVEFLQRGVQKAYLYIPPYGYSLTNYSKFDPYRQVYVPYVISLKYKVTRSLQSQSLCSLYINTTLQASFRIDNQEWSQFAIQYYEPYTIEFNVKCYDNDKPKNPINFSLSFHAKQLHCQSGEINQKNKCIPCEKKMNQYSLASNARYCKTMDNRTMQSAELCFISLKQGFWRADYRTDLIEACLLQLQTCNGGSNYGDQSCMQGYIGALCFECDSHNKNGYGYYYRRYNGSCSQDQYSLITGMSLPIYIILLLFVVHISVQIYKQYEINKKQFSLFYQKYAHIVTKHKVNSLFVYIVLLFTYLQLSSLFHDRFTNKILTITQEIGLLIGLTNYSPLLIIDNIVALLFQTQEFIYLRILLYLSFSILIYNLSIVKLLNRGNYTFINFTHSLFYFYQITMTNYQKLLIELATPIALSNKTYIYSNSQISFNTTNYVEILAFAIPQLSIILLMNALYLIPKTSRLIRKIKLNMWILELKSYLFKADVCYFNTIHLYYITIQIMVLTLLRQYIYVRLFVCILFNQAFLILMSKIKPYFKKEFNQYFQLIVVSLAIQVIISSLINISEGFILINILSHAQDLLQLCSAIVLFVQILRHLESKLLYYKVQTPKVLQASGRSHTQISFEQKISLFLKFKCVSKSIISCSKKTQVRTLIQ